MFASYVCRWIHNEDTSPMNLTYEIPRFHGFNTDDEVITRPVQDEPNGMVQNQLKVEYISLLCNNSNIMCNCDNFAT